MGWGLSRTALALVMLMVASFAPSASAIAQESDFNATLQAAEQGDAAAQYKLGVMYHRGQGVAQDFGKANAWFQKAAEQGLAPSQLMLGVMYHDGLGVAQDYGKARAWIGKAAEQGLVGAQWLQCFSYSQGKGVAQNYAKARAWCRRAAEQGLSAAQIFLAIMYANGEGGRKDYVQAYKWAALSAEQGEKDAAKFRDAVAKEMTPSQLAEAERLVAEWKRKNAGKGRRERPRKTGRPGR